MLLHDDDTDRLSAAVDGPQFFLNYFPILDMRVILT